MFLFGNNFYVLLRPLYAESTRIFAGPLREGGEQHLTAGNALKCIFNRSKGRDRKNFLIALLAGDLIPNFVPGPRNALGGLP